MRTTVAVAAGFVLIAGAVGVTAAQASSPALGQAAATSSSDFRVVERALTDTTTDTGKKGDSVGDILTFANRLYDRADKRTVGSDNGVCTRTVVGAAYECTWTNTLDDGSIVVEGPFYDASDSVLAITGGTGKYAAAHGQMRLHARDATGSSYDFTFHVQ